MMVDISLYGHEDRARWREAMELLSLVKASAFFSEMGFSAGRHEIVRSTAERCVKRIDGLSAEEWTDADLWRSIVRDAVASVAAGLGVEIADAMVGWVNSIFPKSRAEKQQATLWNLILGHGICRENGAHIGEYLEPKIADRVRTTLEDKICGRFVLYMRIEETKKEPLSEWDQFLTSKSPPLCDPMDQVWSVVSLVSIRDVWRWLGETLDTREIERLLEWMRLIASEAGIPTADLVFPRDKDTISVAK
jgi:hypothetical protein